MSEIRHTPRQIIGDCVGILVILAIVGAIFAGVALHGLAGAINAFGDGMRAVLG